MFQTVSHSHAQALLADGVLALDVRTPFEYETRGHIPDAWLLPVDLTAAAPAVLPTDGRGVLVYCEHGVRSVAAARLLDCAGVEPVYNLAGGLSDWSGPRAFGPGQLRGPSPWLVQNADMLPPGGSVLDVACGRGRHALLLASAGFHVTALDRDAAALAFVRATADRLGLRVTCIETNLEDDSATTAAMLASRGRYAAVTVFNYLHRPLMPALRASLAIGGHLFYETFTVQQAERGHPKSPAFLLRPGELPELLAPLTILRKQEGERNGQFVSSAVATSRTPSLEHRA